jgi:hypothetical protein
LVEAKFDRNFFFVSGGCFLVDDISSLVFPPSLYVSFEVNFSLVSSLYVEREVVFGSSVYR